ncbi:MAG: O-antigen ligase family protein [Candidatus Binatia bacterium]
MSLRIFIKWWELGVFAALLISIALLGIGRLEFASAKNSMSAWSVSRTTFSFWIILRILLLMQRGWSEVSLANLRPLAPLGAFFTVVTVSLLPDFHDAGDYRYFALACAHAVMVFDIFAPPSRRKWLPLLMGILPIVLVIRGLINGFSVLSFDLGHRFGFPLDHPNTAGFLFSMSFPLGLMVAAIGAPTWRAIASVSLVAQALALVLTYSRGAWFGWGAAMLFLGAATKKWRYCVGALVFAAAFIAAVPALRERVGTTIINPQIDPSIAGRLRLVQQAFQVGSANPVLGVGYGRGRLKKALRSDLQEEGAENNPIAHTHNVYLELFAETGLLGLGIFLWLLWETLRRLWRSAVIRTGPQRMLIFAIAASWCAAIVTGFGDIPFFHHETRIFFFTLLGWACLNPDQPGSNATTDIWSRRN